MLARQQTARQAFGERGVCAVVALLSAGLSARVAAEAANALLNLCYDCANVDAVSAAVSLASVASTIHLKDSFSGEVSVCDRLLLRGCVGPG